MKADNILNADLLDIVFENRNKDYGAYALRRDYNSRLLWAMGGMLAMALLFVLFYYWKSDKQVQQVISTFVIPPDAEVKNVEILTPPPPAQEHPKVAMIKDMVPRIVPDHEKADPPPPNEVLESDDKLIGNENREGEKPTNKLPPADLSGKGEAPAPEAPAEVSKVLDKADVMPEFPGGQAALSRFLQRNLKFDFDDMEPGSRLEIRCRFIVDVNGNVTGIEIAKSAGKKNYDNEVTRVVAKMPSWNPGRQNGRNVNVYFTLPVIVEVPEQ